MKSFCAVRTAVALTWLALFVPAGGLESLHLERIQTTGEFAYDQAERAALAALDVARADYDDNSLEALNAADALVRAHVQNGRAWSANTRTLARETLLGKQALLGADDVELVPSLVNLAAALVADAQYAEGIAALEQALALQARDGDPPTLASAEVLDHLGSALSASNRNEEALKALERSLRIKESLRNLTGSTLARTLDAIGSAAQAAGQYERAGAALRRAQDLRLASGADHPDRVNTLNLMAQQLWFEGRLPESRLASEQAVSLAQRALRGSHPILIEAVRYLAGTLSDLGDLTLSKALKERALSLAETEFAADHHETAVYLNSLAMAERRLGAYPAARRRFERALEAFTKRYGSEHDYVATVRLNLAVVHANLGDYQRARREHARAVSIWERTHGKSHPYVAEALSELATVLVDEGMPSQALPLLDRALAIRERSVGPNHRDVARTLADMAAAVAAIGRPARAQSLATRALRIWEHLDEADAPELSRILALYADLRTRSADYSTAREYYERVLAIRGKVFGPSNPLYAEAEAGLASALAGLGDNDAALQSAAAAEEKGRDHLRLLLGSLPERQALQYAGARPRGLNLMLSLAAEWPRGRIVALDAVIRGRAIVLDEIAVRHATDQRHGSGTGNARTTLNSARQRMANLLVRGPGQMPPPQYAALVSEARQEADVAEEALADESAAFKAERSRALVGLDDVTRALPDDAALVSFVQYERTPLGGSEPASRAAPRTMSARPVPAYLAIVLRSAMAPEIVPLGSARAIDELVTQWRADIAAEAVAPVQRPGPVPARVSGAALRRAVWDRLAAALGTAGQVFIVPDGALGVVPFAALPVGQRSYLLERGPVIHYLSAERDLVAAPAPVTTRGLLAVGGPSFNGRTAVGGEQPAADPGTAAPTRAGLRGVAAGCTSLQSIVFPPLTGTLREVRDISRLWSDSTGGSVAARVLIGRDAGEATFKREASEHRVLHLATHGFFLNGECSPLQSGTRGVGGLAPARRTARLENPLLLSGLALAGANRRARANPDEDDGILMAEEVATLDLHGVEWAVLSACDTGVGEIRAGEGVFGLRRAFQVAGARTVIMSLWSVDDQATRAWMTALYEGRFQRKLSTADAVHQASLTVLRDRRARGLSTHPFYWAAFVAAGDWR